MIETWEDMRYWETGEWQVVEERLRDITKARKTYNPGKKNLFKALDLTPFSDCRVMFVGQDPYPDSAYATGLAFSVPEDTSPLPPTLRTIFDEYESDLHYPRPTTGDLTPWAREGVLLWNAIPSCLAGHSLSHDWDEWRWLTGEIIENLREKGTVFVFFGSFARGYASLVNTVDNCVTIETAHPSPRASLKAKTPFLGSRLFSRINDGLNTLGSEVINWRL